MIPSQFYQPTTYFLTSTTPNEYGLSPSLSDINETGDFTNAYWTGWIKQENAPPSWMPYKFNIIDGNYVFETLQPDNTNFNFGYLASNNYPHNSPIPTFISKYNGKWDGRYYLSSADVYFPNDYDFKNVGMANSACLRFVRVSINSGPTQTYSPGEVIINYDNLNNNDYEFTIDNKSFKISDFLENGWCIKNDNYLYFIADYSIVTLSGYMSAVAPHYGRTAPRIQPMIAFSSGDDKIISCGLSSLGGQSGYLFDTYFDSSGVRNSLNVRDNIYLGGLNVTITPNDLAADFATNGYLLYDDKYVVCYPTNTYNFYTLTRTKSIEEIRKHFNLNRIVTVQNTQYYYGYADGIVYWPEIIEYEYTGNAITGSEDDLADKIPEWIKDGDNTKNEYTENDLPQPEPPIEPDLPEETGDRIENQFSRTIGVSSNFITTYIMNDAQISELGKILWTSWTDDTVTMDMVKNFYGLLQETTGSWDISSVMNFIVSCKIFPFSLPTLLSTTPTRNLYIGTGKFAIQCSTGVDFFIASSPTAVLTAGSVIVPRLYNDFRDYENTNITVYLPYCGNLELNPADVVGKQLNCTYVIDLFSGACTAYLYTSDDGGVLYNVAIQKGKCGFNVPITATNAGQIATMLTVDGLKDAQGIAGMLGTAISSGLGLLNLGSGKPTGQYASSLQGGINGFVQQGFGLEIMQQERMGRSGISCRSIPGGSNFGDFMCPSTAYIQIRRAMYSMPSEYASTVGYTTHAKRYGKVSQFNGFIQCVNVDVSGLSITEEEKNEIKSLLESGIYVN